MSELDSSQKASKSLTLVVGAGASYEVGLPLGVELKRRIAQLLDIRYGSQRESGDGLIDQAFQVLVQEAGGRIDDVNPYLQASLRVRDAMPQASSIDSFIDAHRSDKMIEGVGKLAIGRGILEAESKSKLVVDTSNFYNRIKFEAVEETWFNAFFQVLTENCQEEDIPDRFSRIAIICFNYDRCVEHYIFNALQNYYGMDAGRAFAAFSNLEIYHPYGTVGKLPWMGGSGGMAYGQLPSARELVSLSRRILTFSEGANVVESDISRVRVILASSRTIAFLGFAFHRINMELLFPSEGPLAISDSAYVVATGMGISAPDVSIIREQLCLLGSLERSRVKIAMATTCSALFVEFRRILSFR